MGNLCLLQELDGNGNDAFIEEILAKKMFQLSKTRHPHHPDKEKISGARILTQQNIRTPFGDRIRKKSHEYLVLTI